jgi:hypothetical protein
MGERCVIEDIPVELWTRVRAKCESNGVSVRSVILMLLTSWSDTADHAATDAAVVALFDEGLAEQRRRARQE